MNVYLVILFFLCLDYVEACRSLGLSVSTTQPTPIEVETWLPLEQSISTTQPFEEIPVFMEGREAKTTCESPNLYHQWYQQSQTYHLIGDIPLQQGVQTTNFIIKVEKFDNNTLIFCDNKDRRNGTEIILTNETQKNIEEPKFLTYSERKNVSFSCEEYVNKTKYINIGVINTTSNHLYTYKAKSTNKNFNITHNGTVLCCVYYVVTESQQQKTITRFIANKTLLVYYHDEYRQDSLEGTGFTEPNIKTFKIYVTSAVAGAIMLLIIITIIVVFKKHRNKSSSDPRVVYVDLDILRQPESYHIPDSQEESPYAQIIGEIRPQNKVD